MNHTNILSFVARLYAFAIVAVVLVLGGCGSYRSPSNSLNISVSPASITMPVNSSVTLQASGSLSKYTVLSWTVQEASAAGVNCTVIVQGPPPPDPDPACKANYGWIDQEESIGFWPVTTVTYNSPARTGAFHVQADASINQMSGQAVSNITVQ